MAEHIEVVFVVADGVYFQFFCRSAGVDEEFFQADEGGSFGRRFVVEFVDCRAGFDEIEVFGEFFFLFFAYRVELVAGTVEGYAVPAAAGGLRRPGGRLSFCRRVRSSWFCG